VSKFWNCGSLFEYLTLINCLLGKHVLQENKLENLQFFFLENVYQYWLSVVYNLDEQSFFNIFSLFLNSLWDRCSTYEESVKYRPRWPYDLVLLAKSVNRARRTYRRNKTNAKLQYDLYLKEIFNEERFRHIESKNDQKMEWAKEGNNIWKYSGVQK